MQKQDQKARQLKKEKVAKLAEKIASAKTIAFTDYHGLNAQQLSELRNKIKEAGGELVIIKNTLLSRALEIGNLKFEIGNSLVGPTASLFAYTDEVAPIKAIAEIAKTTGVPKFKFGFFGKQLLDASALENLAKIPTHDVLQSKLVGVLSSPIYGIMSVLQANIRNLISVLDQAAKKSTA